MNGRVLLSEDEVTRAITNCGLEAGMNYLIHDGVVYGAMVWANGGIAYTETWKPGDSDYEMRVKVAAGNPHTIYKGSQQ